MEFAGLHEAVLSGRGIHDQDDAHRMRALALGNALDLHEF